MGQNLGSLYGLLVIPFNNEDRSNSRDEENEIREATLRAIGEAAYFLAEKRGFTPGHELEDWLEAETQVMK